MSGPSPPSSPPASSLPPIYNDTTALAPEDFRLDSLLDDPLLFDKDLFSLDDLPLLPTIAPLHNPFPAQLLQRPHPVEPGAGTAKLLSNASNTRPTPAASRFVSKAFNTKPIQNGSEVATARTTHEDRAKGLATVSIKEVLNNDETLSLADGPDAVHGTSNTNGDRRLTNTRKRRRTDSSSSPSQRPSVASSATTGVALNAAISTNPDYVADFDFLHLPAPPLQHRRQPSQDEVPRIPPLLQGLHEPPPDAGLFPPITENAFRAHSRDESASGRRRILTGTGVSMHSSALHPTPSLSATGSTKTVSMSKSMPSQRIGSGHGSNSASTRREIISRTAENLRVPPERTTTNILNQTARDRPEIATTEKTAESSVESPGQARKPQQKSKTRRRWTDEEIVDLLAGVSKFGIGRWKKILAHPEFTFHGRSAVDLKDRFRVCCPEVYSQSATETGDSPNKTTKDDKEKSQNTKTRKAKVKATSSKKTDLHPSSLSKILAPDYENAAANHSSPESSPSSSPKSKDKCSPDKPQTHSTLSQFPVSTHRKRHPFSPAEDAAILRGVAAHGIGAWRTIIRTEPLFQDGHRRPTDLRDRMRTLHPERFPGRVKAAAASVAEGVEDFSSKHATTKSTPAAIPSTVLADISLNSQDALAAADVDDFVTPSPVATRTSSTRRRTNPGPDIVHSSLPSQSQSQSQYQPSSHNQSDNADQSTYTNLLPLPFEATQLQTQLHINPLVTWKPASGLF